MMIINLSLAIIENAYSEKHIPFLQGTSLPLKIQSPGRRSKPKIEIANREEGASTPLDMFS